LNVHRVHEARQTELHATEPLLPEPSVFHVEMAIEKIKYYKSPGINQVPAELIKRGLEHLATTSVNFLVLFGIRRNA